MKRKNLFNLLMILGLMLATFASLSTGLGGGISMAQRAQAQEPGPQGQSSIQAAVGDAFTYQGRLLKSDTPVDVACDFQFSLWDAAGGGSQVGSTQTASSVDVADGYFSAPLDFGNSAFQGDARYLQIATRCPAGSGSYTTLNGRVALTAAPYAHSLRPGAVIEGASTGNILSVQNTSTSGYGVYGKSGTASGKLALFGVGVWGDGDSSVGVYGTSNSSGGVLGFSTSNSGVAGISTSGNGVDGASTSGNGVDGASATGKGVYGEATASSGINYGVYGKTTSPDGYGVYAQNTASGGVSDEPTAIYGEVNAANGFAVMGVNNSGRGVYGEGHGRYGVGGFSYASYGVFGKGLSGGIGVMGESAYTGTVGIALASTGDTSGVYGKSVSPNGAGGRFVDLSMSNPRDSAGIWAGSYWSDIIQGYELNADGSITNLRFRVDYGGDVYADGTYSSPAADFAEMLPAAEGLEPGDVLVIGLDGQLARNSAAYQPTVVGVYSTKPGFLGGSGDDMDMTGKIPLAIVGIVPVKASAENGPIAPGDLLVASSIPGYAMKAGANPPIGTVIGKALEGLESGVGVIQLLVTLQ